jgi:hypothetical protein
MPLDELGAVGGEAKQDAGGNVTFVRPYSPGWDFQPSPEGQFPMQSGGLRWRPLESSKWELKIPAATANRMASPFRPLKDWRQAHVASNGEFPRPLAIAFAKRLLLSIANLHQQGWRPGLASMRGLYVGIDKAGEVQLFLPDLGFAWIGSEGPFPWTRDELLPAHLKGAGDDRWADELAVARQFSSPKHLTKHHPDCRRNDADAAATDVETFTIPAVLVRRDVATASRLVRFVLTGQASAGAVTRVPRGVLTVLDEAERGQHATANALLTSLLTAFGAPGEPGDQPGGKGEKTSRGAARWVVVATALLVLLGLGAWKREMVRGWFEGKPPEEKIAGKNPATNPDADKKDKDKPQEDPLDPVVQTEVTQPEVTPTDLPDWPTAEAEIPEAPPTPLVDASRIDEVIAKGDRGELERIRGELLARFEQTWKSSQQKLHVPLESRAMLQDIQRIDARLAALDGLSQPAP